MSWQSGSLISSAILSIIFWNALSSLKTVSRIWVLRLITSAFWLVRNRGLRQIFPVNLSSVPWLCLGCLQKADRRSHRSHLCLPLVYPQSCQMPCHYRELISRLECNVNKPVRKFSAKRFSFNFSIATFSLFSASERKEKLPTCFILALNIRAFIF